MVLCVKKHKRDVTLPTKVLIVKAMVFPVVNIRMWELGYKEGSVQKNWWLQIVVLDLESPLDCKEIRPVHPKGNQPWILSGRTDAEAEAPILWPPDAKNHLTGKDWCWERLKAKGEARAEDEMAGQHHWLNTHECESPRSQSTEGPGALQSVRPREVRQALATAQQSAWWCPAGLRPCSFFFILLLSVPQLDLCLP